MTLYYRTYRRDNTETSPPNSVCVAAVAMAHTHTASPRESSWQHHVGSTGVPMFRIGMSDGSIHTAQTTQLSK